MYDALIFEKSRAASVWKWDHDSFCV